MNKAIDSHEEFPNTEILHERIPHKKMVQPVDLHVHSNRSDGTFSPTQLVDYAMEKGLAAFALTDHDTIDGLEEAISYAESLKKGQSKIPSVVPVKPEETTSYTNIKTGLSASVVKPDNTALDANTKTNIPASASIPRGNTEFDTESSNNIGLPHIPEVIPGIEFSTEYQGQDVHIVGLYIDYHNESFRKQLQEFVDSRDTRNRKMCLLLQEHGIHITYDDLLAEFPDAVITRAHYAKYMLNHGYINSMKEAFERYIDDNGPCYVPREKVTPEQAVKLILAAGGLPILAHPILYHMSDERLDTLTAKLKNAGLVGIEAIYSTYTPAEERQIRTLAAKYKLLVSGGSDFHGANKPGLDLAVGYGKLFVPCSVLQALKDVRNSSPVV